jgi:hypothetical protein
MDESLKICFFEWSSGKSRAEKIGIFDNPHQLQENYPNHQATGGASLLYMGACSSEEAETPHFGRSKTDMELNTTKEADLGHLQRYIDA